MHLILAFHNHQPPGNLGWVVEEACDRAYLPFLEVLGGHEGLRINMHYSGALLEWIEAHRPDVLEALLACGEQLEWIGGGFYEPILPVIPPADRVEQIERMARFIADRFGRRPRGLWLAERVWDPNLPTSLAAAGVEYVPLDDTAFLDAGLLPEQLDRPFVTDHLGDTVTLFPISEGLRYAIPAEEPPDVVALLRDLHERHPDGLVVAADDGEKFGLWPGSHERVYRHGWLDRFLTALQAESDWLTLTTFEEYLDTEPARGQAAVPPASYREMTAWALPPEVQTRAVAAVQALRGTGHDEQLRLFRHGGYWPSFLVEYPEAGVMYRKMLRLSAQMAAQGKVPPEARTDLLRAQTSCPYWHGSFGGIYYPHLRAAVHGSLIAARVALEEATRRGRSWADIAHVDWDADGDEEIHVELPDQSWVLDPHEGGSLHYYDDKPARWATADVLRRRFETYHPELVEDVGELLYDRRPHRWLSDLLLPGEVTAGDFAVHAYRELAPLAGLRYSVEHAGADKAAVTVRLEAQLDAGAALEKEVQAEDRFLEVSYRLTGLPAGRFGPQLPVAVQEGGGSLRVDGGAWHRLETPLRLGGHRFRLRREGVPGLTVSLRMPGELYTAPVRTLSRSQDGVDEILQGVVLWPHWRAGGAGSYQLRIEVADG